MKTITWNTFRAYLLWYKGFKRINHPRAKECLVLARETLKIYQSLPEELRREDEITEIIRPLGVAA